MSIWQRLQQYDSVNSGLDIFDEFNIQVSIKNLALAAPSTVVKATSSALAEEGWGCDETLYEVLRAAGAKSVKGTQQAQTVIRVKWVLGDLSRFANDLAKMIACVKR